MRNKGLCKHKDEDESAGQREEQPPEQRRKAHRGGCLFISATALRLFSGALMAPVPSSAHNDRLASSCPLCAPSYFFLLDDSRTSSRSEGGRQDTVQCLTSRAMQPKFHR